MCSTKIRNIQIKSDNIKHSLRLIVFLILLVSQNMFAQGLLFKRSENVIEERTSYKVFAKHIPTFKDQLTLDFDLQIEQTNNIGYIFRLVDKKSDKIYNLFLDLNNVIDFELNDEGIRKLIVQKLKKDQLPIHRWIHIHIMFNLKSKWVLMNINGIKTRVRCESLPSKICPDIFFGKNDYLIDVPAISIKNIIIADTNSKYYFPLNETHGNKVHDNHGNSIGLVDNPYWKINDSYNWKKIKTLKQKTRAGVCFDPRNSHIYYFTRKNLIDYNITTDSMKTITFHKLCPLSIGLGMNFLDESSNSLYAYEVYQENKSDRIPSVARLNLKNMEWNIESYNQLSSQRHHHATLYDQTHKCQYIFGGFGSMTYSNELAVYNIKDKKWKILKIHGESPHRYFVSMGSKNNYIYLFGGMGNLSGSQSVGRKYFYDFYRIDINKHTIEKLWEIEWKESCNMVPIRNMIIIGNYFYTLCYPEYLSESHIRLYRFDMRNGSYQSLGDSIPIISDKISTDANIFYDKETQRFIATVQIFEDDIASTLNIYSINAPAISTSEYDKLSGLNTLSHNIIYIALGAVIISLIIFIYKKKKRSTNKTIQSIQQQQKLDHKSSSIYLFGDFKAYNRQNKDISYMFTGKLKETFCIILQYSYGNGISSKELGNLLWSDRPLDRVKNLRSVTLNHLRKVLQEIDGIKLVYENHYFKLIFQENFYCDYNSFIKLIENDNVSNDTLINILSRGKFLSAENQPTLDSFKTKIDDIIIPLLTRRMIASYECKDYGFSLKFAQIIEYYDSLDINAHTYKIKVLKKQGKLLEAQEANYIFDKEYKKIYNEEYKTNKEIH